MEVTYSLDDVVSCFVAGGEYMMFMLQIVSVLASFTPLTSAIRSLEVGQELFTITNFRNIQYQISCLEAPVFCFCGYWTMFFR